MIAGSVLSAIGVSLSVVVDGYKQVGESAFGTVVDDAVAVPDAGLGLPAVAAHQAALPGSDEGQASDVAQVNEVDHAPPFAAVVV